MHCLLITTPNNKHQKLYKETIITFTFHGEDLGREEVGQVFAKVKQENNISFAFLLFAACIYH